jgi:hypothetical protein
MGIGDAMAAAAPSGETTSMAQKSSSLKGQFGANRTDGQ